MYLPNTIFFAFSKLVNQLWWFSPIFSDKRRPPEPSSDRGPVQPTAHRRVAQRRVRVQRAGHLWVVAATNRSLFFSNRISSGSQQSFCWTSKQRILNGELSLYRWPPVWLVWNQLFYNWQYLFLFAKQTNTNQSNRRSMVQWYFPL